MMLGHRVRGTSAEIINSPITVNIHVHVHTASEPFLNKLLRGIYAVTGQRHRTIENAANLSEDDIQRSIVRISENR